MKPKAYILFLSFFSMVGCAKSNTSGTMQSPSVCSSPTELSVSSMIQTGATVSWKAVNGAASYDVEYKKAADAGWTSAVKGLSGAKLDIINLSPSSSYECRVKANCSSGSSNASAVKFATLFGGTPVTGLASQYQGDVNIQNDPNVLFVEKFDDGLPNIFSRYTDKLNTDGMSLDTDIPAGSINAKSIKMTSVTGGVSSGGHLFKKFSPGFDSVVYVRYYVKYPATSKGYHHHESLWFGGYNPATDWPNPQAGTCGLGSSRLSISFEPVWQETDPPGFDTYIYWGDMHQDAGGNCWGNVMVTEGATGYGNAAASGTYPLVSYDQWMCVEVMLKLNNPVSEYNGELAVWVNGVSVGHWGPGFPNGHWDKDKWYNNPADPPFKGFRWRTDAGLNINWLWLEYYHENPAAPSSYMKFSNIVMATKYIGPIKQ